jgi:hypothetical protein
LIRTEQFQWSGKSGWQPELASSSLGTAAQLVLVFGPMEDIEQQECLAALARMYPKAQIAGCSTAGEIHRTTARDSTIAVAAIAFEHSFVRVCSSRVESVERSFAAGAELARKLPAEGLRHAIVFAEGIHVNASEFVRGINSGLPKGVVVSGGFAGDGDRLQTTRVYCGRIAAGRAAVAIGFYGERLAIGVGAVGGWRPFGPDRLITRSQQNILYEIDNRPALALYKQYLGNYAEGLPATGLMFPLEVTIEGRRVLRALLGVDETEQSITFAGNLPEGSFARFMVGQNEDLIAGAEDAARASIEPLKDRLPQLSLVVSCNGRRFVLKQRIEEELEAARDGLGADTPMVGFYSYGEIAPTSAGGRAELHNETATVSSLAEA